MRQGKAVGYGLIGCGAFGWFCLEQYRDLREVRCVAVADLQPDAARSCAAEFEIDACENPKVLLARDDVQLVHVAAPPFTHKDIVLAALRAGKHVLCEKPLAVTLPDAEEMVAAARDAGLLLAVNLVMRYNPLCEAVREIIQRNLLGEPLHGCFINDAKDEPLPPGHWFWDREKSGGIFVEHGIHFFDLFSWWFGRGHVLSAHATERPGTDFAEQVSCTVRYGSGILVNFYHGFHQPARMDRQEMRIVCERGEIRLFEWVPTRIEIDCLADRATLGSLREVLPRVEVSECAAYLGEERKLTGRHKSYEADGRYRLRADSGMSKEELYGRVLRRLLADQVEAIRSPGRARRVTEADGISSLEAAVAADRMARRER